MHRVIVEDATQIQKVLSSTDSEWADIILLDSSVMIVSDSAEIFAILQFAANCSADARFTTFRVNKRTLSLIASTGVMLIDAQQTDVTISFSSPNGKIRSAKFPFHPAFTASFNKKIQILSECESEFFDASEIKKMYSIAKVLKTYIEIENGMIGLVARDGTRVFQKTSIPSLCLTTSAITALCGCSWNWRKYKTYVIATSGNNEVNFGIIANMSKGSGVPEYELVEADSLGSAAIVSLNVSDVIAMLQKLPGSELQFNLRNLACTITMGETQYTLPLDISEIKISDNYDGIINPNTRLFTDVITKSGDTNVKFVVKKNFNKISCGDITILGK